MSEGRELQIRAIKNGIVIDHIQAKKSFEIYNALKLGTLECSVAIIINAKSKKMGKKDIIKIDKNIDLDLNVLGYIDPNMTINIIKNNIIHEKYHVNLPSEIINIEKCKNPIEQDLDQVFILKDKNKKIYGCKYCETIKED